MPKVKKADSEPLENMTFRAPVDLRQKLEADALINGRSITAEIRHRLEQSYAQPSNYDTALADALAERLLARISQMEDHLRTVQWMEGFRGTAQ